MRGMGLIGAGSGGCGQLLCGCHAPADARTGEGATPKSGGPVSREVLEDLAEAFDAVDIELPDGATPITFGSWIGGDRDGNPFVTHDVTLEVAEHRRTRFDQRPLGEALDRAGLEPADIGTLVFVTVTGLATPSIDARLCNRLGLRPAVRRGPIFEIGRAHV